MRLRLFRVLFFCLSPFLRAEEPRFPDGFQEEKFIETGHFRLYHEAAYAPVGITGLLEGLYAKLMLDLGDFAPWARERKIEVFVYADAGSYVAKTGIPAWSAAFADPSARRIHCYDSPALTRVLAHEMAHLFFTPYFEETGSTPPSWLNEGIAKTMEWSYGQEKDTGTMNRGAFSHGQADPLPVLMSFDYHHQAYASPGSLDMWYQQSASVTSYLMHRFPRAQFLSFCDGLRRGKTSDQALKDAYGFQVPDVAALERSWRESLSEK